MRKRGAAIVAAGLALAAGLACSGLGQPRVVALEPTAGSCGAWTATVRVAGLGGQTVQLRRDGQVVETWPGMRGNHTWSVEGEGLPGEETTFEVEILGTSDGPAPRQSQSLILDGAPLMAELRPSRLVVPPGSGAGFDLWVSSRCPLENLRWRASTPSWSADGEASEGVTRLDLPPHPDGVHELRVDVVDQKWPRGEATATLVVGDARGVDLDGDGYPGASDCDDTNPQVNPAALERSEPNGVDDNCDGRIDEGTAAYDDDNDGLSENDGDCNDSDAGVRPGAPEIPDCRDNDCDGAVDEDRPLRPGADDAFEAPGDEPYRFPERRRRLTLTLPLVSRDRSDVERISFWSQDGDWDDWGIDVVARRLPAASSYAVEIRRDDGAVVGSGTLSRDGEMVGARGAAFRDDSGTYEVIVRPVQLYADGCPFELYLEAR